MHNKFRRESIRWLILLTLNNARPSGCIEPPIISTIRVEFMDVTQMEVRRELGYLRDRELVTIEEMPDGPWRAKLTRHGIDVAEYTVTCEPGISRPDKYWTR